jgi:hypothetical protein
MNEETDKRVPVPYPKQNVQTFVGLVLNVARLCNIQKIPELDHQVELLVRAAESYIWQKEHGGNPARDGDAKRRFIVIFKSRFRVANDYDYPNTITPVELKMIEQLIDNRLKPKHIDSDYFLAWFFDSFLARKPTFNPATIKLVCSLMVWGDFMYDNRDNLKEKKEQALQDSSAIDLINRAREAIRRTENMKLKTKISELIKKYRDEGIIFTEFKKKILEFEKESKQGQDK